MPRELSQVSNRISPLAALIAFSIATVILAQGITAPFVKDAEPQAAAWIQDVAGGHHLLVPRDYYGELARKPPLFYWVAGLLTAATGGRVDEVRARIVSVFAGASIAVVVLIWTATFLGVTTGWFAFLFLLGSYAFTSRGALALDDMMLMAFVFAAWCLLYQTIEEGPSRRTIIAIGVVSGLGILAKGPVAIVLPAFGAVIYLLLIHRSIAKEMRRRWPWTILAISAAIALLWYIPALLSHGDELARIIFQENVGHFLPSDVGGTGEAARPVYYIAMKLIGGSTPLNFLLPALTVALIHGDFASNTYKPLMFQLSFLIAMLFLFSVASAKRDDYILPGIPSLAILFAALFTSLRDARIAQRLRDIAAIAAAAIAIGGLGVASLWISSQRSCPLPRMNPVDRAQAALFISYYVRALSPFFIGTAFAVVGSSALIVSGVWLNHPDRTAVGLGSLSLLGVLTFTAVVRPEMSRERTLKYVAAATNRIAPNAPIYVINQNEELSFYLRRKAPQMIVARDAAGSVGPPVYLFAYKANLRKTTLRICDSGKLIKQWDRLGELGAPALYEVQPQCVKPQFVWITTRESPTIKRAEHTGVP